MNLASAKTLTPARVFTPRKGNALSTQDWLTLRADHAFARDAVYQTVDFHRDFQTDRLMQLGLFEVSSKARDRQEFILHPELGRQLHPEDRNRIPTFCSMRPQLQILLGDGLSANALVRQGPPLLLALWDLATQQGWHLGRPFLVHQARVGLLNDIGNLLEPEIVVMLIGERPGLGTSESLSAYMAYRPNTGDTDANRNLISNIHGRGVGISEAATRILALAQAMRSSKISGVTIKETQALPGYDPVV